MVMGGATLYRQALPFAQRLYLTFIDCDLPGDTWFPDWDPAEWRETQSFFHAAERRQLFCLSLRTDGSKEKMAVILKKWPYLIVIWP